MKAIILFILSVAVSAASVGAQQGGDAKLSKRERQVMTDVRAVLDAQVAAWNRGDIEGFMRGYNESDDTIFISGDTVTRGWRTVLNRYKKGYDTREKMGTLTFSEIEMTPLAKDAVVVTGRWQLKREKDEPKGRFTLIFRHTAAGWRIVHDHTS
ncbi:MAG TPA: nuclear transport factor 2 family protein [Pyrinomonadaceae bacterium]|nr:nuclear transport factor 2 family protein [Pyrinomonadaceae bacterium]